MRPSKIEIIAQSSYCVITRTGYLRSFFSGTNDIYDHLLEFVKKAFYISQTG
jgi:hypothetical protein